MDRIFIENLHVDCLVGVTEEERRRPQGVVVDVSIFRDLRRAAQTGKVGDTVDYREDRPGGPSPSARRGGGSPSSRGSPRRSPPSRSARSAPTGSW
ncbi:MAG: dihydroneopterin aldolase [Nitrososphaerota archaeon]|nr:dihydroneopterin aldolase [Nitrososphaerota archaeon]